MECEECGALFEINTFSSFFPSCCLVCVPETKIEKTKNNDGKVFFHLLGEFNNRYNPMIHDILSSTDDPNEITMKMSNVIFSDVATRVEKLIYRCNSLYDIYLALKIKREENIMMNDYVCEIV